MHVYLIRRTITVLITIFIVTTVVFFVLRMIPGDPVQLILGIEAPLWTETVSEMDHIEYLVFPRLPGYAEIGWSAPEARNWDEYKIRLAQHGKRFQALGIDYYQSALVPWE